MKVIAYFTCLVAAALSGLCVYWGMNPCSKNPGTHFGLAVFIGLTAICYAIAQSKEK